MPDYGSLQALRMIGLRELAMTEPADIVERLNAACVGHPHATIPWPHRLLHEARDEIERLREVEAKFVQMALDAERIAREAGRQLTEERQRFGEGVASYATTDGKRQDVTPAGRKNSHPSQA